MIDGFLGRALEVRVEGERIATVQTKSLSLPRTPIDTSNEEDTGYRYLDPRPETREAVVSAEGVTSERNYRRLLELWGSNGIIPVTVAFPFGEIPLPANDGAFMVSLVHTGQFDGFVSFTVSFLLSGVSDPAPLAPAPLPPPPAPPEPEPEPDPLLLEAELLTSRPYALESFDYLDLDGQPLRGAWQPVLFEEANIGGIALDGVIVQYVFHEYDMEPEELLIGGTALEGYIEVFGFDGFDLEPEELDIGGTLLAGDFQDPDQLFYTNWEAEEASVFGELVGGTLE